MSEQIAVIGAGSWGTALSSACAATVMPLRFGT